MVKYIPFYAIFTKHSFDLTDVIPIVETWMTISTDSKVDTPSNIQSPKKKTR